MSDKSDKLLTWSWEFKYMYLVTNKLPCLMTDSAEQDQAFFLAVISYWSADTLYICNSCMALFESRPIGELLNK